ncbi:MAG: hypothetical protein AAFO81_01925 [Pseudomonadota bacterium]
MTQNKAAITIEKVLVRDDIDQPQAILIVGTTSVDTEAGDIWVHLGDEAFAPEEQSSKDRICELASIIGADPNSSAQVSDLYRDCNATESDNTRSFYGIECEAGRSIWVADIYVSDHRRWTRFNDVSTDIEAVWRSTVMAADAGNPLVVTAWQQPCSTDSAPLDDDGSAPRAKPQQKAAHQVAKPIRRSDIEIAHKFAVGILFIHGIGNHKVRDTLTKFGEPIAAFWDQILRRKTHRSKAMMSGAQRKTLKAIAMDGFLRQREDRDGIRSVVDDFDIPSDTNQQGSVFADSESIDLACGAMRIEDSFFPATGGDVPVASSVRLAGVGPDGKAHEAHVLMAESYWSDKTVYPSASELFEWINKALPSILFLYACATLRPELHAIRSGVRRIFGSSSHSQVAFDRKNRSRMLPIAATIKLPVDITIALVRLVLLSLLIPAAIIAQSFLNALAFISLIPNEAIKKASRSLIDVMMGTVGQSYALKTSPLRRNAIISKATKDLDWLRNQCSELVVVSHSQGAEVARLLLRSQAWTEVKRWFSLGSGIKPLSLLEPERTPSSSERLFKQIFTLLLVATILSALAWLFMPMLTDTRADFRWQLWYGWSKTLILSSLFVMLFVVPKLEGGANYGFKFNPNIAGNWTDFFASHDPVPAGSLQRTPAEGIEESLWTKKRKDRLFREVCVDNYRSVVRDHTTYFKNTEQFVGPVATDVMDMLGFKASETERNDAFFSASRRRHVIVYAFMLLHKLLFAVTAIYAVSVFVAFGGDWSAQIAAAWQQSDSTLASVQSLWADRFFHAIGAPLLPLALSVMVAKILLGMTQGQLLAQSRNRLVDDIATNVRITAKRL